MEKKEQLLLIEPQNELKFRGPFSSTVSSHMRLTNTTDKTILFKIKTTAPKKYCVRPNCGTLGPRSTTQITICLQPFNFDPNEKNKHKFMVQSLVAPEGEIDIDQLWKEVSPDQLMDSKLKCVFELPVEKKNPGNPSHPLKKERADFTDNSETSTDIFQTGSDEKQTDDLAKASAELRILREEESHLRQENIQLKEQVLRLRMNAEANTKDSAGSGFQNSYSPPAAQDNPMSMTYMALAILMAIVGLILGKFVL